MDIKPLNDRVLVKRHEPEEEVRGGIIVPDTAKEKPLKGEVRAVGPGRLSDDGSRMDMTVTEGDDVLVGKYTGTEITLEGDEHVVIREDEILGILE